MVSGALSLLSKNPGVLYPLGVRHCHCLFTVHMCMLLTNECSLLGVIRLWLDKETKARTRTKCSGTHKEI